MLCSGTSSALSAWVIESPSKLPDAIFVPMTDVGVVQGTPPAEEGAATEAVDTWSDSVTKTRKALESGAFWGILLVIVKLHWPRRRRLNGEQDANALGTPRLARLFPDIPDGL